MLPTTMPPALAAGLVPDHTLAVDLLAGIAASPFASVLQASLAPAPIMPASASLPAPAGGSVPAAVPSPATGPAPPELATPPLSLPIRTMTVDAPMPADLAASADAAPAEPAAPAVGGASTSPDATLRKPAAARAAEPCAQAITAAPELLEAVDAAPFDEAACPDADETVPEKDGEQPAAPVTAALAAVVSPAAAIVLPTVIPATLAARPAQDAPAPVTASEPRGRTGEGDARAMPALHPAGPEGEPRRTETAADGVSAMTPAVPLASGAEPAPITAETVVAAEVRAEPSSPLSRELPLASGRTGPAADAPPAGASSFAPQLQAAVTFAGQAERVTARLFAHQDEGGSRLTIELDPMELGSVEVDLRLDDRGTASATFTVERPETLQLLQRDTRTLVDLLAGAGFSVDAGSLGFELRQDQQQARQQHQSPTGHVPRGHAEGEGRPGAGPAPPPPPGRGLLDLRV